jgi:alkylation response protein AidB-like acyl-CoA dehydrogenase
MDFSFSPEEESFRTEIRSFLDNHLPNDWSDRDTIGDDGAEDGSLARTITKGLADKKWL